MLQYEGERITVLRLMDIDGPILIINVYFPFKNNSSDHRVEYLDLLGCIENIMLSNPTAKYIITGDFNYNIYDTAQLMSSSICTLVENYDLISTHDLDSSFSRSNSYTRYCHKSNSYSILDYIFISRTLRSRVRGCGIDFDGRNPSDNFPLSLQLDLVPVMSGDVDCTSVPVTDVCWSKVCDGIADNYQKTMEILLDSIDVPKGIVHGDKCCSCEHHIAQIRGYYQSVISVIELADKLLPRKSSSGKKGKDFWTESLSQLKSNSVDAFNTWSHDGRPSSGPSFERKKSCHYVYKAELRRQRRNFAAEKSEALSDKLLNKDFLSFWRDWRRTANNNAPPVSRVGNAITKPGIASVFQTYFQEIYGENGTDAHRDLQRQFQERFPAYYHSKIQESISPFFITWDDMLDVTSKLKQGKSTNNFLKAEHVLHGSPRLIVHLHILFNAFLQHSIVPDDFSQGTISPVVKDSSGDLSAVGNYRGVTLSNVFSHMFENALRMKFSIFLTSNDLQFGFKPKHSTNHAVFTLKSCIDFFTKRDSHVYAAFLDFSKAFDRISHHGLFLKLMDRNVPLCFLLLVMFWYLNMEYDVKWASSKSNSFRVLCGTKQGGFYLRISFQSILTILFLY